MFQTITKKIVGFFFQFVQTIDDFGNFLCFVAALHYLLITFFKMVLEFISVIVFNDFVFQIAICQQNTQFQNDQFHLP